MIHLLVTQKWKSVNDVANSAVHVETNTHTIRRTFMHIFIADPISKVYTSKVQGNGKNKSVHDKSRRVCME